MSHYDWLKQHLTTFINRVRNDAENYDGMIAAHGDKCYGYREKWSASNVTFDHGVALYMLARLHPYSKEVRETATGWVDPAQWVIDNYEKFVGYFDDLPAITNPDYPLLDNVVQLMLNARELIQDDLVCVLDGRSDKLTDKACQAVVDRMNTLIEEYRAVKKKEQPPVLSYKE